MVLGERPGKKRFARTNGKTDIRDFAAVDIRSIANNSDFRDITLKPK